MTPLPPVLCYQMAALAIAGLYYVWRDVLHRQVRDGKLLRERVTYMLWVSTQR